MEKPVFTEEALRARFDFLTSHIKNIEDGSPRLERDANYGDLSPIELAAFDKKILEHEEGLFELKQEYARLAKLLGGRSMSQGK